MPPDVCRTCRTNQALDFDFTFAFQPIVDWRQRTVIGYEALVRGIDGAGAPAVLARVREETRAAFDRRTRIKAIELAARLFTNERQLLSINVQPHANYDPVCCLTASLCAARSFGFPTERLMFEVTEHERVQHPAALRRIASQYGDFGFTLAIDDFGNGWANLGFLADFIPHVVKLDSVLVRDIHRDRARQSIVRALVGVASDLGIRLVAEGVETREELAQLLVLGCDTFQGFLFARPGLECLPPVDFAAIAGEDLASAPPATGDAPHPLPRPAARHAAQSPPLPAVTMACRRRAFVGPSTGVCLPAANNP